MKKLLLTAGLILEMSVSSAAFADNTLIYSFEHTSLKPGEWTVMPVIAELSNTEPETLFHALKKRKLPSYGSTEYNVSQQSVSIDETKCAYSSMISAEIGQTFAAHGHRMPKVFCGKREIPAAEGTLMHFVHAVPLWQAISAKEIDETAIIDLGGSYISVQEFKQQLSKKNKTLVKAITAGFSNPNTYVKSGLMQGYIQHQFPGAEKRVSQELSSKTPSNVNAALTALSRTKNAAVIKQMKSVLNSSGDMQESYALALMNADSPDIQNAALLILLKSQDDVSFNKAAEAVDANKKYSLITANLSDLLTSATPIHAKTLARLVIEHDDSAVMTAWLEKAPTNATSHALAETMIAEARTSPEGARKDALSQMGYSVQLTEAQSILAFDALDDLEGMNSAKDDPRVWIRGLESPYAGIRIACAEHIAAQDTSKSSVHAELSQAFNSALSDVTKPYLSEATIAAASSISSPRDSYRNAKTDLDRRAALAAMPADAPELSKPTSPASVEGGRLLGLARQNVADNIQTLSAKSYHDSAAIRRDIAAATRWMNEAGDPLRLTMLKDADESVAETVIRQFKYRPAAEIKPDMIKQMTARAERSSRLKQAVLTIIPNMMNEKTVHLISTYASNQLFDTDVSVKIAAIRALGEIASRTSDAIIADNALTSLAMTAQDTSDEIVHHTLVALAKTHHPTAAQIISRAKTTHPKSYERALKIYPFM